MFVCLFGVFVLFFAFFPDPHLRRAHESSWVCPKADLWKRFLLKDRHFFLTPPAPHGPPGCCLHAAGTLACHIFMTSPIVVFVRQVEGESAVVTSPDDETNLSGWFFVFWFFLFFSRGAFLRFLEREQRP